MNLLVAYEQNHLTISTHFNLAVCIDTSCPVPFNINPAEGKACGLLLLLYQSDACLKGLRTGWIKQEN